MKTIATAIAALALSASPAVLAQTYPQGAPDEGYQGYQGYQGYGDQGRPDQAPQGQSPGYPPAPPDQGAPGYQGQGQGYQGQGYRDGVPACQRRGPGRPSLWSGRPQFRRRE